MKTSEDIAKLISQGTKEKIEAEGKEYTPIDFEENEQAPTDTEREEFNTKLIAQIEEGAKDQKKANKLHEKMFGGKNYLKG